MSPSAIIEETKIPKLGKHSHIKSGGNFSTDIPVARQTFTATRAAPAPIVCHLGVLFNIRNIAPAKAMVAWVYGSVSGRISRTGRYFAESNLAIN